MKKTKIMKITGAMFPICAIITGLLMCCIAPALAGTPAPHLFEIEAGESKTISVSNAYVWTNTDPSVAELNSRKGDDNAAVKALKPGIATISVGTSVGQVMTFSFKVFDKTDTGGNGDNGGGDGGNNPGGDGGGDNSGDGNDSKLMVIPGLSESTRVDTVLNIEGSEWIVIKNIEMEGSKYAMLLKKTAMNHIIFEISGTGYDGSALQSEFTKAFNESNIPEALYKNAVVPKLGDDSMNAVSVPTSKMASESSAKKDIIFPLSYKEAVDWSGSTNNHKLNLESQRWWLRTPDGSQWYYVITYVDSPNMGSIISSPAIGIKADNLHLRPAIWVKYE